MSAPSIEEYRARAARPTRLKGGKGVESEATMHACKVVTAVTVSFNSARTISRTIDSIKAQTYPAVEYIVIDGGSNDGTLDILRQRESDIDLWISEPDDGISDAFNKGIALASGEYVALINSDDWLESDHFAIAIAELQTANVDFVFGDLALHALNGRRVHFFIGESNYKARIEYCMPFINHPTVVCRRAVFDRVGLFDRSLGTAMDYDWFLRLHKLGGLGRYSPRLLGHMTLEGQSDLHYKLALREVRDVSIRHGYPARSAWIRYAYHLARGNIRRALQSLLPLGLYEHLRKRINAHYRNSDDRPN